MNFVTQAKLAIKNFIKYLPLLQNLIARELKNKYRQSVLGYVWCVLNPLLVMLILNFVFSKMFKNSIENFPVYLFVGRMFFSFMTDSTQSATRSIVANGSLMRKTRVPNYIFTLATLCSAVVNFLFSLIAFAFVLLFTRTPITIHAIMLPVIILQMFMFCTGFGFFLAQSNVFLRDTSYLYAVFITAWMYLTPLFYPLTSLPQSAQWVITTFNPAYFYIEQGRMIFLYQQWPTLELMLKGFGVGLLFLAVGMFFYQRNKDKFILYI